MARCEESLAWKNIRGMAKQSWRMIIIAGVLAVNTGPSISYSLPL
jgi:hypothetical protein